MKRIATTLIALLVFSHITIAQTKPPLLPEPVVAALSVELSGETAKRNLEYILRGGGGEYAYEALNLVDGKRSAQEIRDAVSAIYGPVPLDPILEYLRALEEIKVVQKPKQ